MSWGWAGATWFGGGGWEERNLKGRLEPGTSVANGSIFDNICRGQWWGRREGRGTASCERSGRFAGRQRLGRRRKGWGRRRKIKTGLGIFHQCPQPSDRPSRPHKISLRVIHVILHHVYIAWPCECHCPNWEIPSPETSSQVCLWPRMKHPPHPTSGTRWSIYSSVAVPVVVGRWGGLVLRIHQL